MGDKDTTTHTKTISIKRAATASLSMRSRRTTKRCRKLNTCNSNCHNEWALIDVIKHRQTRGGLHPTRTYCRFHEGISIIVEIIPCIQSSSRKRTAGLMETKQSRGKQRNERVGTASRPATQSATIYVAVEHWAAYRASGKIEICVYIYLEYILITCHATLLSTPHCTVW